MLRKITTVGLVSAWNGCLSWQFLPEQEQKPDFFQKVGFFRFNDADDYLTSRNECVRSSDDDEHEHEPPDLVNAGGIDRADEDGHDQPLDGCGQ
jgi:hypothetical protein